MLQKIRNGRMRFVILSRTISKHEDTDNLTNKHVDSFNILVFICSLGLVSAIRLTGLRRQQNWSPSCCSGSMEGLVGHFEAVLVSICLLFGNYMIIVVGVHGLVCLELNKFIVRISQIFPAIETARPRCTSGIQALCVLHVTMDKAKAVIQLCSESSKLYLAIIADKVVKRCEQIRDNLDSCLSQIQNLVPVLLAAKISGIIHDLRSAKFPLDSAEDEAGKVVLSLLRQDRTASTTVNVEELEALQLAASKLNIMSPLALLIERRAIKSQLNKINDTDVRKKKILKYLQYLLRKYRESISQCQNEGTFAQHEGSFSELIGPELQAEYEEFADTGTPEPPEGFKCPISMRLMYDPVIIASGKTFERIWIERWFDEGNRTCPLTHSNLDHLYVTPNSAMKGLISKWCLKHGIIIHDPISQPVPATHPRPITSYASSISSFDSDMNDLRLQVSSVSLYSSDSNRGSDLLNDKGGDGFENRLVQTNAESHNVHYFAHSHGNKLALLSILAELSWECQCRAVEDVKNQLEENDYANLPMVSNDHITLLISFLKTATELSSAKAQREGVEVLLAILCRNRGEIPPFHEDVIYVMTSYLGSEITGKVLAGMEVLSREQYYKSVMLASGTLPSILKILETQITEFHTLAMKVLLNLSSHKDIGYHIVYLDYIPKLVQLLGDRTLAPYCIEIMSHLSKNGEARIAVAESIDCLDAIARLLEIGTKVEQEHAVDILLSLCHGCAEYCQLVNRESIIESLVSISVNGNSRGIVISKELLQLLERFAITDSSTSECVIANAGLSLQIPRDSAKKSSPKAFRFLVKKVPILTKRSY